MTDVIFEESRKFERRKDEKAREERDLDMELEEYAAGMNKEEDSEELFANQHTEAPVKEIGTKVSKISFCGVSLRGDAAVK